MTLDKFRRIDLRLDKAYGYIPDNQFAKQGDYNGVELVVQLADNGVVKDQSGTQLLFKWRHNQRKNSGQKYFEALDLSQGIFKVTYPTQMLFEGTVTATIHIIQDGNIIPTRNFTLRVEKDPTNDNLVVAENDFSVLQEALLQVNEWNGKFEEKYNGLEEEYNEEINSLNRQLAEKPNHDTVWTMANMGQDIKESWTNGAVAVVGVNGVQRINLTDSAVGVSKLDAVTSDLIGVDKVYPDWVLGEIQNGSINELAKIAVSSQNFIVLDKPVTLELSSPNFVYNVFYYELDGTYRGLDSWDGNKRTIPVTENRKIRVSVRYTDSRLFEDIFPLINNISIVKQHTSLSAVSETTKRLDTRQHNVIQQLVGLEKQDFGWEIGRIQSGQFNPNSRNALTSDFITLDDEVKLSLTNPNEFKFVVLNYTSDGSYINFEPWRTDELTIGATENRKIRVSIAYNDDRLFSDIYPLLQAFTILKQKKRVNDDIPIYWEEHLTNKINTIAGYQKTIGWDGTSFAFITDVHWNNNAQNSPSLLKRVVDDCDIPYILDGGDFCANPSNVPKQEQLDEIAEYRQAFSSLDGRILRTLGNHDDNSIRGLFSETIIDSELYNAVYRQNSKYQQIVSGKTGKYYYIDDTMHKVRYITLNVLDIPYIETTDDGLMYGGMTDPAFRQEQVDWFTNYALNVPNDEWGVVVVTHIPINTGVIKNDHLVMNALQAFKDKTTYSNSNNVGTDFEASVNVDYSNGGGEVYCWLAGHHHLDMAVTLPTNITFPEILTLNDNMHSKDGAPTKVAGTTSEQAFDVVTIDKVNRKLLFTRIGAGEDREFDY